MERHGRRALRTAHQHGIVSRRARRGSPSPACLHRLPLDFGRCFCVAYFSVQTSRVSNGLRTYLEEEEERRSCLEDILLSFFCIHIKALFSASFLCFGLHFKPGLFQLYVVALPASVVVGQEKAWEADFRAAVLLPGITRATGPAGGWEAT